MDPLDYVRESRLLLDYLGRLQRGEPLNPSAPPATSPAPLGGGPSGYGQPPHPPLHSRGAVVALWICSVGLTSHVLWYELQHSAHCGFQLREAPLKFVQIIQVVQVGAFPACHPTHTDPSCNRAEQPPSADPVGCYPSHTTADPACAVALSWMTNKDCVVQGGVVGAMEEGVGVMASRPPSRAAMA